MSDFNNNNNSAINANTARNRKKKAKKKAKKQNPADSSSTPSEISTPNLTDRENVDSSPLNDKTFLTAAPIDDNANVGSNNNTTIITDAQTTPVNTGILSGEASAIASSLPAKPIDGNISGNNNTTIITDAQTTPENTGILSGEASAIASSLPAKPIDDNIDSNNNPAIITDAQTTPADTGALSGEGSAIASSLPTKVIKESHGTNAPTTSSLPNEPVEGSIHDSNIPATGPVGPGAHGATAAGAAIAAAAVGATAATTTATTSNTGSINTGHSGGFTSLYKPLPLSDNVKYAIKSVIASGSIDLDGIVDKIRNNIALGDYKEKAKLPPMANTNAAINPKAAVDAPNNPQAAITSNNDSNTTDSNKNHVKKAVAGVGAAVAGASATVAGANKLNHANTNVTTNNTSTINKATVPPPPTSTSATTTATSEASKLSESVQYCIKSATQAPSVNVYGIINSSQKVKRPEAAVGPNTQPTMPSSAKAPDVPKKTTVNKSSENRNKPTFRKKKNCIIL
ncbi:hypothetical protein INT46_010260 [Mucor plumbeus]|uniref:Uncharacterized protein n=1 Tax=Mucor plumbeus TaxID=97098 RepID=A0A8H7QWF1_9FUNG|nr:hypothetical protein INT46_010260 [Mucor plumbeus]